MTVKELIELLNTFQQQEVKVNNEKIIGLIENKKHLEIITERK